jgi:hypothetical protein
MTPQQQLAQRIAERAALVAQRDTMRQTISSNLLTASQGSPYGTQETRNRLASWSSRLSAGEAIPISEIDSFSTGASGNPEWIYFGSMPNYSGMSGAAIGTMNSQLRAQNREMYSSFLSSDTGIGALDAQIAELTAQLATANNQPGAGGTGTPGSTPPGGTPPPQEVMQEPAATRDRARRDIARVAFGSPRFGVGLNIPLGT